jgi:PAS domain S-box-containing protein
MEKPRTIHALLRDVISSLGDAVFIVDAKEGTIVECNASAERALGCGHDAIVGRTMDFLRSEGMLGGYESVAAPLSDDRGRHMTFVVVVCDVSRSAQAVEEQQKLLDSAPAFIFVKDLEGRHVLVNKAIAETMGIPKEEWIGKKMSDLLPKYAESYRKDDEEVISTGRPKRGIIEPYESLGDTRWAQTDKIPRMNERGEITGIFCFAMDITARKMAEENLHRSEERYRELVENLNDMVYTAQTDGTITYISPVVQSVLGHAPAELVGMHFSSLIHPEDRDSLRRMFVGTDEESAHPKEFRVLTKDGGVRWVISTIRPILERGRIVGFQGRMTDITENKRSEAALKESEREIRDAHLKLRKLADHLLSAREQERRTIAQEIHDELGQVLTALKMDMRWMEKRLLSSPEPFLSKLRGMIALTDQTIVKVQRLSMQLRPRMLDDLGLSAAIEWLTGDFSRRTGIPCKTTVKLTESRIGGNSATVIFRLVQESLTNIERHARASAAVVDLHEESERIEVRVADNGVGISQERVENPKSFGLIGIMERALGLGGDVSIRGEPARGTTVSISIPYPSGGALA